MCVGDPIRRKEKAIEAITIITTNHRDLPLVDTSRRFMLMLNDVECPESRMIDDDRMHRYLHSGRVQYVGERIKWFFQIQKVGGSHRVSRVSRGLAKSWEILGK